MIDVVTPNLTRFVGGRMDDHFAGLAWHLSGHYRLMAERAEAMRLPRMAAAFSAAAEHWAGVATRDQPALDQLRRASAAMTLPLPDDDDVAGFDLVEP